MPACFTPREASHFQKGILVYTPYKKLFSSLFDIFFSSGRGSFVVLSAPWHTGIPHGPHTQVWAPVEVRGTCSGGWKWHVRSGRHSEHVEPSRPMQTHTYVMHYWQVKKVSGVSCDIWDLECHQCRQTLHTWWWKSFSPTPTCLTCDHLYYTRLTCVPLLRN